MPRQLHDEVASQNAKAAELIAHRVHGWANALRGGFGQNYTTSLPIPREFAPPTASIVWLHPQVHYLNVKPKAKGIALTGAEIAEQRNKCPRVVMILKV